MYTVYGRRRRRLETHAYRFINVCYVESYNWLRPKTSKKKNARANLHAHDRLILGSN